MGGSKEGGKRVRSSGERWPDREGMKEGRNRKIIRKKIPGKGKEQWRERGRR